MAAQPQRSTYAAGPAGDKQFQLALQRWQAAQPKQPVAPVAAPKPSTPVPVQKAPTSQPVLPATQPPAGQAPAVPPSQPLIQGFDKQTLLKSGISEEQITKMEALTNPQLQANANAAQRATEERDFMQKDLKDEQKQVSDMYAGVKKQKEDLANESLQINDQSAKVQGDLAAQEYQKNQFTNSQAEKQYDLDQSKNKAKLQTENDEADMAFRKAIGAQLGAAFSSEGIYRYVSTKKQGSQALSDLDSQTAIGKAEFAFKAQDISSNYYNKLSSIENDRKTQAIGLKTNLSDDLADIDSKVLMSAEEKRAEARKAVSDYYSRLNDIDQRSADSISEVVTTLYKEKKELEQEKETKEGIDLPTSQALGYFANKFGDPIGIREGEAPKPFTGSFNEALSKQFGFLVDQNGNPIIGNDGKKVKFTDFSQQSFLSALGSYREGTATESEKSQLNEKLGTNNAIAGRLEQGKWYPSPKYGNLQCGEYINNEFLQSRQVGSTWQSKKDLVTAHGFTRDKGVPNVGDSVMMDYGTSTGHIAIVNTINEDGSMVLTDANRLKPGVIDHNFVIKKGDKNWNKIYGFARLPLKADIERAQPIKTVNKGGTDGSPADDIGSILTSIPDKMKNEFLSLLQKDPAGAMALAAKGFFGSNTPASAGQYDIDKFKGNPTGFLALEKDDQDRLKGILSDDQIQQVIYQGKSINDVISAEQKAKMDALNKKDEKATAGKPLSDSAVAGITKFDSIESSVKQLDALAKTMDFDPKTGWAREHNPWDDQAQQFKAIKQAFSGPAARAIMQEVGALTDSDLLRLDKLLPSMSDTKETAIFKIGQLKELLTNGRKKMLENYQKAGRDVSDFMDEAPSSGATNSKGYAKPGSGSSSAGSKTTYSNNSI